MNNEEIRMEQENESESEVTKKSRIHELKNELKEPKNIFWLALTLILSIQIAYTGVQLSKWVNVYEQMLEHKNNRGTDENILEMVDEIHNLYEKYYIGEEASKEDIEDGILAGYALSYDDPYGYYLSPEETKEFIETKDSRLMGGIGIQTRFEQGMEPFIDGDNKYKYSYYITEVYPDTPAQKAGIKVGDRLVQVEDVILTYVNSDSFLEEIRGEAGTDVNIKILRNNLDKNEQELIGFTLTRADVKSKSISTSVLRAGTDGAIEKDSLSSASPSDIGYIQIWSFTNETDEEYAQALTELSNKGIEKYILDVRNNGGGIVESVVDMLDRMIPEGIIAELRCKDASQNITYKSEAGETNGEFIVLVNERSASASELFSKTLQEYGKATILGKPTYGKGTVIQTIGLSNGGSITISTGEYYTSKGENLEGTGVEPDIEVTIPYETEVYLYKLPLSEDLQLVRAIEEIQNMS